MYNLFNVLKYERSLNILKLLKRSPEINSEQRRYLRNKMELFKMRWKGRLAKHLSTIRDINSIQTTLITTNIIFLNELL